MATRTVQSRPVLEAYGYSVVFVHGPWNFALAHQIGQPVVGRAFFQFRRDAVQFKRALAGHQMATKVVKVRVQMTVDA